MNIQNLLNQFIGSSNATLSSNHETPGAGNTMSKLSGSIPGGLAGGAAAGGIMALLVGNKSARKFAGKAAGYGGAAVLGGLAYKAFQNWQQNNTDHTGAKAGAPNVMPDQDAFAVNGALPPAFELTLIKAMIAAAKADGHIDDMEQQRIFKAVEQMDMSIETKGMVFNLLGEQISVEELAKGAHSMEQKSELYLASCLAINPDHPSEQAHLDQLASALELPEGFKEQLHRQAQKALSEAA